MISDQYSIHSINASINLKQVFLEVCYSIAIFTHGQERELSFFIQFIPIFLPLTPPTFFEKQGLLPPIRYLEIISNIFWSHLQELASNLFLLNALESPGYIY